MWSCEAVAVGFDDITLGFDLQGTSGAAVLDEREGVNMRRGKLLGSKASWGQWAHALGRHVAIWRSENKRLYVQAKFADAGALTPPEGLTGAVRELTERLAAFGVMTHVPIWVTRADVAVDLVCESSDGKLLLDALEAVRLPHGWRTTTAGNPRSTVYFRKRASDYVLARSYCRNLKTRMGPPFGRIRLEAEHRWRPFEWPLERLEQPACARLLWELRFGGLSATISRLPKEAATVTLKERIVLGEMGYAQAERMLAFLDAERLGVAHEFYPASVLRSRRREARELGLSVADLDALEAVDLGLGDMLRPAASAFE